MILCSVPFHFNYFTVQLCYIFQLFVKHFCIIWICASIPGSSLLSLLRIHFQINCPSLAHLVVVLEFYLFLHLGNILLLSCFCLTFCICGLFSAGYRIVVLASGVCSLVGEFGPGACAAFLVGWTADCPVVSGARSLPSGGQSLCLGLCVFRGSCGVRQPADGWGCAPARLLVWLVVPQPWSLQPAQWGQVLVL